LVLFFILTFVITWGIGAFAILLPAQFRAIFGEMSVFSPLFILAVAAPTISATILTLVCEGWSGLGALYARLIRWRFGIPWYALVLIGIPVLGWLTSRVAGADPTYDLSTPALIFAALLNLLITGPLGEELGWRGYALPRLLKRFNPFVASLILGAIWGVWHLPSFFVSSLVQAGLVLPIFLFGALCTSILATWVFQHTGGSVLVTVLLHYMLNFSLSVVGAPFPAFTLVMLVPTILVVLLDKRFGWFKR
jgi:CAAX protease family protein